MHVTSWADGNQKHHNGAGSSFHVACSLHHSSLHRGYGSTIWLCSGCCIWKLFPLETMAPKSDLPWDETAATVTVKLLPGHRESSWCFGARTVWGHVCSVGFDFLLMGSFPVHSSLFQNHCRSSWLCSLLILCISFPWWMVLRATCTVLGPPELAVPLGSSRRSQPWPCCLAPWLQSHLQMLGSWIETQ